MWKEERDKLNADKNERRNRIKSGSDQSNYRVLGWEKGKHCYMDEDGKRNLNKHVGVQEEYKKRKEWWSFDLVV